MKARTPEELLSRITSISVAGVGSVSWSAGPNERKICEEIATYLEDQGIFHAPFEWEHPKETYDAASAVRTQLTTELKRLNRDMGSFDHIDQIRQALQSFQRQIRVFDLTTTESKSEMTNEQVSKYDGELIRLRNVASARLARVAAQCKFSIRGELWQWLP